MGHADRARSERRHDPLEDPVWRVSQARREGHEAHRQRQLRRPVVTAGGLLFIGATSFDRKFHAYDKLTGRLLWETTLPFAGSATPSVYEINGRQYIVIVCGGGKNGAPSGSTIVAFTLG